MQGPDFLWFFGLCSIATLVYCARRINRLYSGFSTLPRIPEKPSPYEIAYLRGGAREVLWVALLSLYQSGYLTLAPATLRGRVFTATEKIPSPTELNSIERSVYSDFASPTSSPNLYLNSAMRLEVLCHEFKTSLQAKGLLVTTAQNTIRIKTGWCAFLLLGGLGGYKILIALSRGHSNIGFLLILEALTTVALLILCGVRIRTPNGEEYLKRLQQAYSKLRTTTTVGFPPPTDDNALLLAGLFGMSVFSATDYAPLSGMYVASVQVNSAGNGDGSSCSSTSSCGNTSSCSGGSSCSSGGGCGGCSSSS